nr:M23 family metallopeptidase [Wansuia hejianensis]
MFKENGFLLFLFVCVCVVSASTIFILTKDVDNPKDNKQLVVLEDQTKEELGKYKDSEDDLIEASKKADTQVNQKKEEEEQDQDQDQDTEKEDVDLEKEDSTKNPQQVETKTEAKTQHSNTVYAAEASFILPLDGEIITEFTTDSLVYSKTLDEWRAHTGIDIKGKIGEKVKASKDGTVKEVYEDPLWGNVIVIEHNDGLLTKYANLGTKDMVKVGVKVKRGDHIGTIGKTADIEMLMEPHLHFEVIKNGKNIDPRSIK